MRSAASAIRSRPHPTGWRTPRGRHSGETPRSLPRCRPPSSSKRPRHGIGLEGATFDGEAHGFLQNPVSNRANRIDGLDDQAVAVGRGVALDEKRRIGIHPRLHIRHDLLIHVVLGLEAPDVHPAVVVVKDKGGQGVHGDGGSKIEERRGPGGNETLTSSLMSKGHRAPASQKRTCPTTEDVWDRKSVDRQMSSTRGAWPQTEFAPREPGSPRRSRHGSPRSAPAQSRSHAGDPHRLRQGKRPAMARRLPQSCCLARLVGRPTNASEPPTGSPLLSTVHCGPTPWPSAGEGAVWIKPPRLCGPW